jgi:hypothetical protein
MSNLYETSPAAHAVAVTASDSADLPGGVCRALYVGTTGNISLDVGNGQTVLFTAVPVGILPVNVKRVRSTSTTASNIVALY